MRTCPDCSPLVYPSLCPHTEGEYAQPVYREPRAQKAKAEDYCCRCGHVHQGVGECGVDMGGGGFCRCQLEGVPR